MTKSRGIYERHGHRHTAVYAIWCGLRGRCNSPTNAAFDNYGGRGIKVCARWSKFTNFLTDMGEPSPGMSLERIDNNKGYSKENCIWADRTTQGRNKRNNVLLTIDGETLPLSAWAERAGLKYATVHQRISKGWAPEDAVKAPLVTARVGIKRGASIHKSEPYLVSYLGEQMTLEEAATKAGLKFATVYTRIRRGWSAHDALSERPHHGPHSARAEHGVVFHEPESAA